MKLLILLLAPLLAQAHAFQPALLTLEQSDATHWDVSWTPPTTAPGAPEEAVLLAPVLPDSCTGAREGDRWTVTCPSLSGELRVGGLERAGAEVVVRIEGLAGSQVHVLRPESPSVTLGDKASPPLLGWLRLGTEHILFGFDHLLFVLGLVLLVPDTRRLLLAVTAFTIAHSLTLAGAALGALSLPGPPVEAVIALSILLLAREALDDRETWTKRWPWLVAFGFGLIHGFGFAGALAELDLPLRDFVIALLQFNLGVEAGQLMVVAVVLVALLALRNWQRYPPLVLRGGSALAVLLAAIWLGERVFDIKVLPFS